jgi:GNAT superfamily N-acetyltransferase
VSAEIKPFNWRRHSREVLAFQRETYQMNFPGFIPDRDFMHQYGGQLRRAMGHPSEGLFVLEEGGKARGFLWVALICTMTDPCIGYIKNIYVVPELRSFGHGRRLLAYAEAWCLRKGVLQVTLDASCCNERALRVYEAAGYATTRVRMEKDLDPADLRALEQTVAQQPESLAKCASVLEVS